MSKSEGDISDLLTPFHSLKVGDYIEFALFDDVPAHTVKMREGVIVSIDVQIAQLSNGETTVQTLLGLIPKSLSESRGLEQKPTELVPLEALKVVTVDLSQEVVRDWKTVVPSLGGGRAIPENSEPVRVADLINDRDKTPFDPPRKSKSRKQKNSKKGIEQGLADLYISKRR